MIYLRPHHINCIYFFVGKGYDSAFACHMGRIVDVLNKNRYVKNIKFVCNCDFICKRCPNKKRKNCIDRDCVLDLDRRTMVEYGLDLKKIYSFDEIIKKYYLNYNAAKFTNICSDCEWCRNGTCSVDRIGDMLKKFQN